MQEILSKTNPQDVIYMANAKDFCSVKFGGQLEYLFLPKTTQALVDLVTDLACKKIDFCVLGNMTNVIPTDGVMKGVYISTRRICEISVVGNRIIASSGTMLGALCLKAQENALSGIEGLFGIPATVGGAVFNNAGAFGYETSQTLESVLVLDCGKMRSISCADAELGYRSSIFHRSKQIILSATFMLHKSNKNDILTNMMDIVAKRRRSQPQLPSAGSVFKKHNSLSAGKLIDDCGLKGFACGGAQISSTHANFIVNNGEATSKDYKYLVSLAQSKVYDKFGIILEREVEYLGEDNEGFGRLSHT